MSLSKIKLEANKLKLEQLIDLDIWLHEHIRKTEAAGRRRAARREVVSERDINNRTYRLESVRCGKESCRCAAGELHGPYWYAYWSEDGRTKSQYIGKKLPRKRRRGALM